MVKYIKVLVVVFIFIISSAYASQLKYRIQEINSFGDIINIAGGRISKEHLKAGQIWGNICFVINNPLEEDSSAAAWTSRYKYPLKETYLEDFNETQLYYTLATIIRYYILNAHAITGESKDKRIHIIIHIHRNSSAEIFTKMLQTTLKDCFNEFKDLINEKDIKNNHPVNRIVTSNNISIEFKNGYLPNSLTGYEQANIILSISPVASINQILKPGSIVTPNLMIPMSLDSMTIMASREYKVNNHIIESADKIIKSQSDQALNRINNHYSSENPIKKDLKAQALKKEMFTPVDLIQVDGYFNPKLLPAYFYVIK